MMEGSSMLKLDEFQCSALWRILQMKYKYIVVFDQLRTAT